MTLETLSVTPSPLSVSKRMPLQFEILRECSTSKARAACLTVPHFRAATPMFMPVGTQGTMKGVTPSQLEALDCHGEIPD